MYGSRIRKHDTQHLPEMYKNALLREMSLKTA